MTVAEYIAELQKLPQDLPVCVDDIEAGLCEAVAGYVKIQGKEDWDTVTDLPFPVGTKYVCIEAGNAIEQPKKVLTQKCKYCGYVARSTEHTWCKKCGWKPMLEIQRTETPK
jgi:DNA-directed RNA polymerase subunit RPC12/RpoP